MAFPSPPFPPRAHPSSTRPGHPWVQMCPLQAAGGRARRGKARLRSSPRAGGQCSAPILPRYSWGFWGFRGKTPPEQRGKAGSGFAQGCTRSSGNNRRCRGLFKRSYFFFSFNCYFLCEKNVVYKAKPSAFKLGNAWCMIPCKLSSARVHRAATPTCALPYFGLVHPNVGSEDRSCSGSHK